MKIPIGTRVIIARSRCAMYQGLTGKFVGPSNGGGSAGVELDLPRGIHSCGGRCKRGHGKYFPWEEIEPINTPPIPPEELAAWDEIDQAGDGA